MSIEKIQRIQKVMKVSTSGLGTHVNHRIMKENSSRLYDYSFPAHFWVYAPSNGKLAMMHRKGNLEQNSGDGNFRPKQVNRIVMQLSLDIRWTSRGERERDGDGGDWCLAVLVTIGFDEGRAGVVQGEDGLRDNDKASMKFSNSYY